MITHHNIAYEEIHFHVDVGSAHSINITNSDVKRMVDNNVWLGVNILHLIKNICFSK